MLANLLFEIATGQSEMDLSRTCTSFFEELERDGFYNTEQRRQLRRAAKLSPPPGSLMSLPNDERNREKKADRKK